MIDHICLYKDENDTELIRKQREEIILLTNELKTQEEQICRFQENNLKLKNSIKLIEKQNCDYKKQINLLNNKNESLTSKLFFNFY
jgi:hypothetical protein